MIQRRIYRHAIPLYVSESTLLVTNVIAWSLGAKEMGILGLLTQDGLLLTVLATLVMSAVPVLAVTLSWRIWGSDRGVQFVCWTLAAGVAFVWLHDLLVLAGYLG